MKYLRITDRVQNIQAILPRGHQVPATQNRKLLRERALFGVQACAEIVHADLAIAQLIHNAYSQRMGESLEELRLEFTQVAHGCRPRFARSTRLTFRVFSLSISSSPNPSSDTSSGHKPSPLPAYTI